MALIERCSKRQLVYVHISCQAFNGVVKTARFPSLYNALVEPIKPDTKYASR